VPGAAAAQPTGPPRPPATVPANSSCAGTPAGRPPSAIGPRREQFQLSAFPYDGYIPGEEKKFLDKEEGGRRGHTSPRGGVHWEEQNYRDKSTLLYIPQGFDISAPALIVVFFHGNHAMLDRDVARRQRVPAQLGESRLNAVLVAPQLGFDVADSSAGRFWERGFFGKYLAEAATRLAGLHGDPCLKSRFDQLPVVLVAYSGGYNAAAYALDIGGADNRIHGVILLDALYGETDKFERWLERHHGAAFFFSAYSPSSLTENLALQRALHSHEIRIQVGGHFRLRPGGAVFLPTRPDVQHNDFVTGAWVTKPLAAVLSAIDGYRSPLGVIAHETSGPVGPGQPQPGPQSRNPRQQRR
jgi:hypothetical protein